VRRNGRMQFGRRMRKYAGSCGITTAWLKRRKGMDDSKESKK